MKTMYYITNCQVYADLLANLCNQARSFCCNFVYSSNAEFRFQFTEDHLCYCIGQICDDVLFERQKVFYTA